MLVFFFLSSVTGQTDIIGRIGPGIHRKIKEIPVRVVKDDDGDAVRWSERNVNCVVLLIVYIWIAVLLVSGAGW